MAPIALDDVDAPTILRSENPVLSKAVTYADFRDDLRENGFAVVKGAIPKDRAVKYEQAAHNWINSFGHPLDMTKPETFIKKNLPLSNGAGAYVWYCVAHEKFMWDARQEPGVLKAFSTIWGTDELLVSFDGLNVTFPNRPDVPARQPWEHIDQSPHKRGLHCVQGIINLSPNGPDDGGLVVYPGSHKLNDLFFDSHPDIKAWPNKRDVFLFAKDQLAWFQAHGLKPHKVCAEPGDLILWDSRTIHYGSDPTPQGSQIRSAIYATYMPVKQATPEQLAVKKEVFEQFASTTHWPYEHLVPGATHAILDGLRDPLDRDQPLEPPEMTDTLLKLAGVKPY